MSKAIITDVDVQKRLIKNLNDRPNAAATYGGAKKSANDIKAAFDEQFEFLADKHNELIREIGDVDKYSENESKRIEAENERAAAEAERADAEEIRAVSETLRAAAETERVAAEADREDAESAREAAENERVIAEGERDEFIGELDSTVDELINLQDKLLDGRVEAVAKEEVIKAINETLLIANDLETNDPYKALSAAQGVLLKGLVDEIVPFTYPVGAIYLSVNDTAPAAIFGGTWERLKDRFLLGAGDTYGAGSIGGSDGVMLVKDNLPGETLVELRNTHWADITTYGAVQESQTVMAEYGVIAKELSRQGDLSPNYGPFVQQEVATMPPYLAVHMWKRIA